MLFRMKHIAAVLACFTGPFAIADAGAAGADAPLLNAPYITGTHYSARELLPAWFDEVGQPVNSERLDAIARRIEQMYQRDGFLIPLIVTEGAAGSTPHLHVFEARVHEVQVRGDAGAHRARVAAVAAQLESQPVLHKSVTQRAIHELEQLPGLSVRAGFDPVPGNPNSFALTLRVRFARTEGSLGVSSRVSDEIGDALLSARLRLNGALGMGERLSFTAASSSTFGNYAYASGRVEKQLGRLDVGLFASHAESDTAPDSSYDAQRYAFETGLTWLRADGLVIRPLLALSARNTRHEDDDGAAWSLTRTRTVEAGIETSLRQESRVTRLRIAGERGLDGWNALAYRRNSAAPDHTFTKFTLDAAHARVLAPGWQLRAGLEGQWSDADLPPGERFTYGGSQFGRAFDPGAMIADRGASGSLQLDRYRQWDSGWLDYGRAFVQADYAIGQVKGSNGYDTLRGASASAGVAGRVHGLTTTLEAGYALQGVEPDANRLRFFVSTQYAF